MSLSVKGRLAGLLVVCALLATGSTVRAQQAATVPNNNPHAADVVAEKQTPPVDPAVAEAVAEAVKAFNATDFAKALEVLKKVYTEHPNLAPPRLVLAQWFAQAGLGDAVRTSLEMATEETPEDPEAFLLLGEIMLRQQSLTAAELLLQKAGEKLQAYNANPERRKLMVSSLLRNQTAIAEIRGRWEQMAAIVDARIRVEGENAQLLRAKAVALFRQKKDAEAKAILDRADLLEAKSENKGLPAEAVMSQLYLSRGEQPQAKQALATALQKYPTNKEVLALSIQDRINDGNLAEAKALADKLGGEDPNSAPIKRLRGMVALYMNDYPAAEKFFQELILASPTDMQASNGLALALCEQGDADKLRRALEYAAGNAQKQQNNSDFLGTLGWVLVKTNQLDKAAQVLRQAAAGGQINAATAFYLAKLASLTGKNDDAKKLLDAAVGSKTPFAKRQEATQLLKEVSAKAGEQKPQ